MNAEQARRLLERLATRWRRWMVLGAVLEACGGTLAVLAALRALSGGLSAWFGAAAFASLVGALLVLRRKRFGDTRALARHLDRTLPRLQESCELVLEPVEPSSILQRLQRRRVLEALDGVAEETLLPARAWAASWKRCAAGSSLALLLTLLVSNRQGQLQPAPAVLERLPASEEAPRARPVALESVEVDIEPPAYTGRPAQRVSGLALSAAEGSRLHFRVLLSREAESLALVFGDGERLALKPAGPRTHEAELEAWASKLYSIEATEGGRVVLRSDYGRLSVIRDLPPALRVIQPKSHTDLDPDQLAPLGVEVLAQDDYAVTGAELIMTLTSGAGESVQFREQRRPLVLPEPDPSGALRLGTTLDLAALGMAPGDELYFHVEAGDNRQPAPNRGRSETCFVKVLQLTEPPRSGTEGIVINPVPEYFRSQRQIIIDTEKLIAEKPQLSQAEFDRRSNDLGLDQRLLRLRYGTLLGEEFESGHVVSEAEAHVTEGAGAHEGEDEHAGGNEQPLAMGPPDLAAVGGALAGVPEALIHQHDSAETATYFQNEVRSTLKAALAQMWQSELYLRTNRPDTALPHEYEALRLLKSLQEQSRVYVQRVGFEPPPLKPEETRLTGDLSKVAPGTAEREAREQTSLPQVREGLRALRSLQGGEAMPAEAAAAALQLAGQELARQALEEPGRSLEALDELRTLTSELTEGRPLCQECLEPVERALWGLLPPAQPGPAFPRRPRSSLFQAYLERQP